MVKNNLKSLIKVEVKNRSLGQHNNVEVFMTKKLKEELEKIKTQQGSNLFSLFQQGRGLRGFKHLIEKIKNKNKLNKIIFTHETLTREDKNGYWISFEDYRKKVGSKFFALYRETGLDGASFYLNTYFPKDFKYDKSIVSEKNIIKVSKKFPELIKEISNKTAKNRRAVIEEATDILKNTSNLKNQKKLLKVEKEEFEKLQKQSNITIFQDKVLELKERLTKKYPETKGDNSWQKWIYKNNWIFGIQYQKPIEKSVVNLSGSMPDYIFPTMDGFMDILEIKLPSEEVVMEDTNHTGSYRWCGETNKAIGQVVNYLNDIERLQLELSDKIKDKYNVDIFLIKPRAFIVIGNSKNWGSVKKKALRKLNYSLHGIEVLTYSDLVSRGEEIIRRYTEKL